MTSLVSVVSMEMTRMLSRLANSRNFEGTENKLRCTLKQVTIIVKISVLQLRSCTTQLFWHVVSSPSSSRIPLGHAQVRPRGCSRHRCEQPPLLTAHKLLPVVTSSRVALKSTVCSVIRPSSFPGRRAQFADDDRSARTTDLSFQSLQKMVVSVSARPYGCGAFST